MADIPVPRSYPDILGEMLETFVTGTGISSIKLANPILSFFEGAAQSDLRSSEDIFTLLEAISLDYARGPALDRIAADEGIVRQGQGPASGIITITSTAFSKIASKVFQGTAAPIVGSAGINVPDASLFPASGSVYVGRGTNNYEGPIAYTSILAPGFSGGSYYTLVLATGTTQFHNVGESVILAQGGNRAIAAGTKVQTQQGNSGTALTFSVLYGTTMLDGEVLVENTTVVASKAGTSGNIQANTIKSFAEVPFAGASCTNPAPFINGQDVEADESLRERIRSARQTRVRGTPLALQVFATGVTSLDEAKRVLSAQVVASKGLSTVYIDDGTGYEEKDEGIAVETFSDLAYGGESNFKVSKRPIAKAYVATEIEAPFTLVSGQKLSFEVGGTLTTHTFNADEFRAIGNATAYEVVASINSDYTLGWSARTTESGTKVVVFAKADSNEWIQNIPVPIIEGSDANQFLGFPIRRVDTVRLYKNDRLLVKDGALAQIQSYPFSNWASMGPTEDLTLVVDGTPLTNLVGGTYTFTAQDFIDAGTGYTTVGTNSADAWAKVFNYRIPGTTSTVVDGVIVLTSNIAYSDRASLQVKDTCSLFAKGMFPATSSTGAAADYSLDRNTGELELATPLAVGDKLSAGTTNTRAFVEAPAFTTFNVTGSDAYFWFAPDAAATIVPHGVSAANPLTFGSTPEAWGGERQRMAGVSGTFTDVAVGDWLVFWDAASPFSNQTQRVAAIVAGGAWVEFDVLTPATPGVYTFLDSGLTIVRTTAQLQAAVLPVANNYTANSVADSFNTQLVGIDSETYRTRALRVRTTSFGEAGDIALTAINLSGRSLGLTAGEFVPNLASHLASVESGNSDTGTPDFHTVTVTSAAAVGDPTVHWLDTIYQFPDFDAMAVGLRSLPDGGTTALSRYGQNKGTVTALADIVYNAGNYDLDFRVPAVAHYTGDRYYLASSYALAPNDQLTVVVDGDTEQGRFIVPMWRKLTPVGTTYASTNTFKDADNGGQTLAAGFGYTGASPFDFNDFAVYMAARVKTHNKNDDFSSLTGGGAYSVAYNTPVNNQNDLNRAVLWRYYRLGPDGEFARLRYSLPTAEDSAVSVSVAAPANGYTDIKVNLKSGNLCTGYTLSNAYPIGTVATATTTGMTKVFYIMAFKVSSLSAVADVCSFTLDMPAGVIHSGLDLTGATPYYFVQSAGPLATQNVLLSGETLSGGTYKIVTSTITGSGTFGPIANAGVLYLAGSVTASLSGASPAAAQGDFLRVLAASGIVSDFEDVTVRIQNDVVTNPYWVEGVIEGFAGVVSGTPTPTYAAVGDVSAFKVFKNPAETAAAIVAAVQALAAADASVPVRPTLLGTGATIIDRDSAEDAAVGGTWYQLTDGINYIKTTTDPATSVDDYSFLFKADINATLATDSDWANEEVRIVPRTTQNVVDWLNQPTVSGLFSMCEVKASAGGRKVQIASSTPGSAGSVQVQGGTGNRATAAVVGSSVLAGSQVIASVDTAEAAGFQARSWVSVDNAKSLPKAVFTTASVLDSIVNDTATTSLFTFSATTMYTASVAASPSVVVNVEAEGKFVAYTDTGLGSALALSTVSEGDWLRVTTPAAPAYVAGAITTIASGNVGIYRVVRICKDVGKPFTVWVENETAIEQASAEADFHFYTDDSVMPGDVLSISNNSWDGAASNKGNYVVADVGLNFTDPSKLTVTGTLSPVGSAKPALGSSYQQIQVLEKNPCRCIKKILSIAPNGTLTDIKFTTSALNKRIGGSAGSVITALDKLGFDLGVAKGVDGYRHQTGLLAETNKVLYGDPANPTLYPGVVAAGSAVNIAGSLVHRVRVTLSLRIKSGANRERIRAWAKSAVATAINKSPAGESVSLTDLTTAAARVGGVVSATMVSPVATAGDDVIVIQKYEKAQVLDVDADITITFVGEA